jgi:hypothetical protein
MTAANPKRRSLYPTVARIWTATTTAAAHPPDGDPPGADEDGADCVILIESNLPAEAHALAGAPSEVVTKLTVSDNGTTLDWDVIQVNKRPTRLPESTFFTFNPVVADALTGWELCVKRHLFGSNFTKTIRLPRQARDTHRKRCGKRGIFLCRTVLGSRMDPHDVIGKRFVNGSSDPMAAYLGAEYGGSPHLRGVESAQYATRTSIDATVASAAETTTTTRNSAASSNTTAAGAGAGGGGGFVLTSMDVPVLCAGRATPFVTPRTQPPDMAEGVSWNIYQNTWNTNCESQLLCTRACVFLVAVSHTR